MDVQRAKVKWKLRFIQCGHLIIRAKEMIECIDQSFNDFGTELLALAPELNMDRSALAEVAMDRMRSYEAAEKDRRMLCNRTTAAAIDDDTSSARDIAVVVTKQCRTTSMRVAQSMADTIEVSFPMFSNNAVPSPDAVKALTDDLSNPDNLVALVLKQRLARRSASQSTPKQKPKPAQNAQKGKFEV